MSHFPDIWSLPNFWWVLSGMMALGILSGFWGVVLILSRNSLASDVAAHATLPGMALVFIFTGSKDFTLLWLGASATAFLGLWVSQSIPKHTPIGGDGAMVISLSFFFALGMLLLSWIQEYRPGGHSGLEGLLVGKAAAISISDVYSMVGLGIVVIAGSLLYLARLKVMLFDPSFAQVGGFPVRKFQWMVTFITVIVIAIAIPAAGVVLVASFLIFPGMIAFMWTHRMEGAMLISALVGALAAFMGSIISATFDQWPTGPAIVLVLGFLTFLGLLFSPKQGLLPKWRLKRKQRKDIELHHLLQKLYRLLEKGNGSFHQPADVSSTLWKQMLRYGWISRIGAHWQFTGLGLVKAKQAVRKHRIWETYLHQDLQVPASSVHEAADWAEHFIDDPLSEDLMDRWGQSGKDPHEKTIP